MSINSTTSPKAPLAPFHPEPAKRFVRNYKALNQLSKTAENVVKASVIVGIALIAIGGLANCPCVAYIGLAITIAGLLGTAIYYWKKSREFLPNIQVMRLAEALHALYTPSKTYDDNPKLKEDLRKEIRMALQKLTKRERMNLSACLSARYRGLENLPSGILADFMVYCPILDSMPIAPPKGWSSAKKCVFSLILIASSVIAFHYSPQEVIDALNGARYFDYGAAALAGGAFVYNGLRHFIERERRKMANEVLHNPLSPDVVYENTLAKKLQKPLENYGLSESDWNRFFERMDEDADQMDRENATRLKAFIGAARYNLTEYLALDPFQVTKNEVAAS